MNVEFTNDEYEEENGVSSIYYRCLDIKNNIQLRGGVPSKCSLSSQSSITESSEAKTASVKIIMLGIKTLQSKYFNSAVTPLDFTANDPPPSNFQGEYHARPPLTLVVTSIHDQTFSSQAPSKHTECQMLTSKTVLANMRSGAHPQPPEYCCVAISNKLMLSACEGEFPKRQTLSTVYPMPSSLRLIVVSKNNDPPLVCEGEQSKFPQLVHHRAFMVKSASSPHSAASTRIKLAASRKVKGKGLVYYTAISIDTINTISSLPPLSNPLPSVCKGEKSRPKAQPENFGLKVEQGQQN